MNAPKASKAMVGNAHAAPARNPASGGIYYQEEGDHEDGDDDEEGGEMTNGNANSTVENENDYNRDYIEGGGMDADYSMVEQMRRKTPYYEVEERERYVYVHFMCISRSLRLWLWFSDTLIHWYSDTAISISISWVYVHAYIYRLITIMQVLFTN